MYTAERYRPDTCAAVDFLTTRVKDPDNDDWGKPVHLMKYVRGAKDLPLKLNATGSGILRWWIDESFGLHPIIRGHNSGDRLSMDRGFPIVSSTKQKLNTRSFTEFELVAVDD